MASFLAELKRRHIYRVAAAYAVVAWVLIQVVNNITPMLNLPNSVATAVLVLLAVGFPVVLVFAWVQQLASGDGSAAPAATGTLDWALMGALVAVLAMESYQQLTPSTVSKTSAQREAGVEAARTAAAAPGGAITIAVLPFANVSDDRQQEFFSDGMTDEIAGALAKVPDLRVVARSSAFEFKGQNKGARVMGEALGATHLIEGSVRQAGNRVRITAQLIQADNGLQIWSENYDRELTDVFAIQEDIARAITTSLRMPLGLKPGENLVNSRTKDVATYENYLRAKALYRARASGLQQLTEATKVLEEVVAHDPKYTPAWALLGYVHAAVPNVHPAYPNGQIEQIRPVVEASLAKAEAAARRSVELDQNYADGYSALGVVEANRGNYLMADNLYTRASALDPDNPDVLNLHSEMLSSLGYLKQALLLRQRLQVLEPLAPVFRFITARIMWTSGETDVPIAILKPLASESGGVATRLAAIYSAQGRNVEAINALAMVQGAFTPDQKDAVVKLLRTAPGRAGSAETLPQLGALGWAFLLTGTPERVLQWYEGNLDAGFRGAVTNVDLWAPEYGRVRKTARFKAYVRNAGMFDYWRAKGWPDLCHPIAGDDFECD
jgi:TolB-like protein